MSVATNDTPPSNQQATHKIPTQRISNSANVLDSIISTELSDKNIDISAVQARVEQEKILPPSVAILREVFLQVCLTYPRDSYDTVDQLDAFTNRALLTQTVYEDELLDEQSPTGRDRKKYGEVIELAEEYDDASLILGMNDILKSQWVKNNPTLVRSYTIEAYAIACLMTLDAHGTVPSFMQFDETAQ